MLLGWAIEHGHDMHIVARALEPLRQRVRDALQATEFGWRDQLQNDHARA